MVSPIYMLLEIELSHFMDGQVDQLVGLSLDGSHVNLTNKTRQKCIRAKKVRHV